MLRLPRGRNHGMPMILGLCLWMAFPAFQWCAADSLCRAAMGIPCENAATNAGSEACPFEACPLAGSSDSGLWCVGPHAEGLTPRDVLAPPPILALPFEEPLTLVLPEPSPNRIPPLVRSRLCPGRLAPHAPPLTRAPPLA